MGFLDLLPGRERAKRRAKLRSAKEYAKTRESIPNLESLAEDTEHASNVAEIGLALELEPKVQEELKKSVQEVLPSSNQWNQLNGVSKEAIHNNQFTVVVEKDSSNHDAVTITPEGNVAEKLPLNRTLTKTLASTLRKN